jgi:hypothetical protein
MDPGGAPQGIRRRHAGDKAFDLGADRQGTSGVAAGEPGPVLAEAPPLPPQDSVRSDDHERLSPVRPDSGQRNLLLRQFRGPILENGEHPVD